MALAKDRILYHALTIKCLRSDEKDFVGRDTHNFPYLPFSVLRWTVSRMCIPYILTTCSVAHGYRPDSLGFAVSNSGL